MATEPATRPKGLLDDKRIVALIKDAICNGGKIPVADQLLLARSGEEDRRWLARCWPITTRAQELLIQSSDGATGELVRESGSKLDEHVQRELVDQHVARWNDDELPHLQVQRLGGAAQRYFLEQGKVTRNEASALLMRSSFEDVRVGAARFLRSNTLGSVFSTNPQLPSSVLWQVLDVASWHAGHLISTLGGRDLTSMPARTVAALRDRPEAALAQALVANDTWVLDTSMPVSVLRHEERGQEFIDAHAPADRSAWDALLPTWAGSVDDLLVVSTELGA